MSPARPVLIVTALELEFRAVTAHLDHAVEFELPHGLIAEHGRFVSDGGDSDVYVIQSSMGNVRAATETERAMAELTPSIACFVGIAGGVKDVQLGDVVVGSKVYNYESGKEVSQTRNEAASARAKEEARLGSEFLARTETFQPSYRLLQRATAVQRGDQWQSRTRHIEPPPEKVCRPNALIGPLVSGAKVVTTDQGWIAEWIRRQASDALGIEMEGHGFLHALHARPECESMVIRGISDLRTNKTDADKANWQPIAAAHAAAFTFETLAQFQAGKSRLEGVAEGEGDDEFWEGFLEVAVKLFQSGPTDRDIWSEAGGEISRLDLRGSGRIQWTRAFRHLRRGGEPRLDPIALVQAFSREFPKNQKLRYLMKIAPR